MILTYDTRFDVLYLYASDDVVDPDTLATAPYRRESASTEGLTVYYGYEKEIVGVECTRASARFDLSELGIAGMQGDVQHALQTLKAALDPVRFAPVGDDAGGAEAR